MAKYSAEEVLDLLTVEDDIEDGLDEVLCEGSDEEFQLDDDDVIERDREVNAVMRMLHTTVIILKRKVI